MEYLSIKQTSEKWGISIRRIQILCSEDRIPGATKIGSYWAIPADAEKPNDQRIRSGKYIKEKYDLLIASSSGTDAEKLSEIRQSLKKLRNDSDSQKFDNLSAD